MATEMFTETELREALQHSASRVAVADEPARDDILSRTRASHEVTRRHRRVVLPVVAAGLTAALAVGGVALWPRHTASTAVGSGQSTARTASGSSPASTLRSTLASTPASNRPSVAHTPADISKVVDAVAISSTSYYDLAPTGSELITRFIGSREMALVYVIRPSSGFDPGRIPRDHPVRIAGTTGYYGFVQVSPLDGSHSDKYSPTWIVAFPAGGGTWVVAEFDVAPGPDSTYASVPDPARIVSGYNTVRPKFTGGGARLPYRVGYLPAGMAVDSLSISPVSGGAQVTTELTKGNAHMISIDSYPAALKGDGVVGPCTPPPGESCPATASRTVGGVNVVITGYGYGAKDVQRVLDSLTVAPSASDQSGWWTVANALG